MVNELGQIKDQILTLLFEAGGTPLSGVKLSRALSMSRVAVWKHIDALRSSGFQIDASSHGYALTDHADLLLPFCFRKNPAWQIFHFQELSSTMDMAKTLAGEGAPHLSCVIAEHQTLGRGRLNREWFSSRGGLWFTLILKPDTPPPFAYIYNFAASLSLCLTLRDLFGVDVSVKWPNDLLLGRRKLAGLLSEMETRGDMIEFINIGIGINVNNEPEQDEPKAVSLKRILGRPLSRREILAAFLTAFEERIENIDCAAVLGEWKTLTSTIGSRVRIETLGEFYEGRAVDVDETGALIIEDDQGNTRPIIYGDCFYT